MADLGIIGTGHIGSAVARLAVANGISTVLANSRGPESIKDLIAELGPRATGGTIQDVADNADTIVLAIPLVAVQNLPAGIFHGKLVFDTSNYYPFRDGRIAELDRETLTTSELVHEWLGEVRYVKAFNNLLAHHIPLLARPSDAHDRSALPLAADDGEALLEAKQLLDRLGFDTVDAGSLSDSWKVEPETKSFTRLYLADPDTAPANMLTAAATPVSKEKLQAALISSTRVTVSNRQL